MPKHILKTQNFTKELLFGDNNYEGLFKSASNMRDMVARKEQSDLLRGQIITTWFSEESTRTRLSFESAAHRLGASVISSTNAKQFSSISKGESLEDTIRVIHGYCDCIVIRHHEEGSAARAAHVSRVPVINAGDGAQQHPTQALLDLFSIYDELGSVSGIHVALCGDLKYGRTVHSLAYLLGKFDDVKLSLVSPSNLQMPTDITDYLTRHGVKWDVYSKLEDIIQDVDALYQTRIQKNRFESLEEYEKSSGIIVVTRDLANSMKSDSIILHPLPRIEEIRYGVDDNHRAKYFKQAENGVYIRMALLKYVLLD